MSLLRSLFGLAKRILRGEDIVIITQSPEVWEAQHKKGLWDRLSRTQPNTEYIAGFIRRQDTARRILDVGCGNGALARSLAPMPATVEYYGIDFSKTAIYSAAQATSNAFWLHSPVESPPTTLRKDFEIIVFNEILYYVDIPRVLNLYAAYMAENGVVIISIVRSWRTPFLWRRIRRFIQLAQVQTIGLANARWDVGVGRFKSRPPQVPVTK